MIQQNVENKFLPKNLQEYLENTVIKICIFRLIVFIVLSLPILIVNIENFQFTHSISKLFEHKDILGFILSGLFFTLFFIVTWRFFSNVILFFRLQLITDIILATYFLLITGGISSNGSFLFLAIVFLYGRILGKKTLTYTFLSILLIFLIITILQLKGVNIFNLKTLNTHMALYYNSLQISALCLIVLLVRMGESREDVLLREIAKQKDALNKANILKTKVFDWINSGIIVLDKHGNIESINKMGAKILNIHDTYVLTKPLKKVFYPFYEIWNKWDKKDLTRREVKDKGRILGVTLSKTPNNGGYLIIFSDITKIKGLEQRVVQMEKLAAIGELAAGLAHEIKNPLSGIKGSLQLINKSELTTEQKQRLNKVIFRDIERLDNLLKDFLYFARPKEPEREEIDLENFLNQLIFHIKLTNPEVEIKLTPSIKGKKIIWDQDQLKQVLYNLLLNSIQAMEKTEKKQIVIGCGRDKFNNFMIFVQDKGKGIDKDHVKKIFNPFFTTKPKGSGLGLSIAQRLCKQNNCWLEIKNRRGSGVVAKIYLNKQVGG
ncbi:two-component system sensor histidine kinase NtrB [Desulfothermus sp.]